MSRYNVLAKPEFWANVDKAGDCWLWMAGRTSGGYGEWTHEGRQIKAHRHAYALTYGSIPPGMYVCHHCDNPPCVRPDHLFLGSARDNMLDKIRKGRHLQAGNPPDPNLPTLSDVLARRLWSTYRLSLESKVAVSTIIAIERGEVKNVRLGTIEKLAHALGMDPYDMAWPGNPLGNSDEHPAAH